MALFREIVTFIEPPNIAVLTNPCCPGAPIQSFNCFLNHEKLKSALLLAIGFEVVADEATDNQVVFVCFAVIASYPKGQTPKQAVTVACDLSDIGRSFGRPEFHTRYSTMRRATSTASYNK